MIVTTIKDGFGNQLFMYACGYALAKKKRTKLALDTTYLATSCLREYELGGLCIKYDKMYSINNRLPYIAKVAIRKMMHTYMKLRYKQYQEKTTWHYETGLSNIKSACRLLGYWQSEKYFVEYRTEILKMLTPNYETTVSFNSLLQQMQKSNSVSVHVRRGDYVALGICLNDAYYKAAIRMMAEKVDNPDFYVFSDDMEYAQGLFEDMKEANIHFVNYHANNSTIEDFLLMKNCKHNIIANSSYSWWGAWANEYKDKVVICPKRDKKDDFYPSEWIKL